MKIRKNAYLKKMILLFLVMLFIPFSLGIFIFWKYSFDKMEQRSRAHYQSALDVFTSGVSIIIDDTRENAARLVVDSKDKNSSFFYGSDRYNQNMYWYYESVKELNDKYYYDDINKMGIYYYDSNRVITAGGTYSPEAYISKIIDSDMFIDELIKCYDKSYFECNKTVFLPVNDGLLIGYYEKMGVNHDKVFIFYIIGDSDYTKLFELVCGNTDIRFDITSDSDNVLLSVGKRNMNSDSGEVYCNNIGDYPLKSKIYVDDDGYEVELKNFYIHTRTLIILMIVFIGLMCLLLLGIVYHPIYRLREDVEKTELMKSEEGDEFSAIRNVINKRSIQLQEQEELIIDLIMQHMLYGVPIAIERMQQLGIKPEMNLYEVCLYEGPGLTNLICERLTEHMTQKYNMKLFVTDSEGDNKNIFILFMQIEYAEDINNEIIKWLEENIFEKYAFDVGDSVKEMNNMQFSLLSCLEKRQQRMHGDVKVDKAVIRAELSEFKEKSKKQQEMSDEVIKYLNEHYRDTDLSQTLVADYFGISRYTLSKMFKANMGIGFTDYINSKRIECAKELLLTTDYSIREIALMSGFANDNYFSRLFKIMTGISATDFRNR